MLAFDNFFDEDYRQYILPWDGKTKIKINPNIVGLNPKQLSMKVLYVPRRSERVYPPEQPAGTQTDPPETHEEERRSTSIEPSKEYDLPQHLSKIPAKISIFETSPKHQKQLFNAAEKMPII